MNNTTQQLVNLVKQDLTSYECEVNMANLDETELALAYIKMQRITNALEKRMKDASLLNY